MLATSATMLRTHRPGRQRQWRAPPQLRLAVLLLLLLALHPPSSSPHSSSWPIAGAHAAGVMLPENDGSDGGGASGSGGRGDDDDGGFPLNSLNNALVRRLQMDRVPQADGNWIPSSGTTYSSLASLAAASGSGARHYQGSSAAAAALAAAAAAADVAGGGGGAAAAPLSSAQLETTPLLTRLQVRRALELAVRLGATNGSLLATTSRGVRFADQLGAIAARAAALAAESRPERVVALLGELHVEVQRLPPGTSWPAVRRVITAGLALHRLRAGPLAAAGELMAVQLLLRLYLAHRTAAKAKRVVEFAHVSKSGGTTMCQLAERNGCRTESFALSRNCLVSKFDDRPRYINYAYHRTQRPRGARTRCDRPPKTIDRRRNEVSCRRRRKIMLQHGHNLYMNEYTALGGAEDPSLAHACGNMLTVLQIRHPYARVMSHVKHMWHAYSVHCRDDKRLYFPHGHNATHWSLLLSAPMDNYLVRSLAGEAVFGLPSGGVTEEHLGLARVLLMQQYDVLLVLEDPSLSHAALSYGLGWAEQQLHVNSAQARGPEPGNDDGLPQDPEVLYGLNRLDLELYGFGVAMAQLDAVVYDAAQALGTAGASLAALQAAAEEEEAEQDYAEGLERDYAEGEEDEEEGGQEEDYERGGGGGDGNGEGEGDYVDEGGRDQRGDSSAALTDDEGVVVEAREEVAVAGRRSRAPGAGAGIGAGVAAGVVTSITAPSSSASSSNSNSSGGSGSSGSTSSGSGGVALGGAATGVTSRRALHRRTLLKESVPPAALTPRQRNTLACGFVGQYEPS